MKKYILLVIASGTTILTTAQVVIGTLTPKTTLHVTSDPTNISVPKSMQAPSLSLDQLDTKGFCFL
jgi:hypothetical protein